MIQKIQGYRCDKFNTIASVFTKLDIFRVLHPNDVYSVEKDMNNNIFPYQCNDIDLHTSTNLQQS